MRQTTSMVFRKFNTSLTARIFSICFVSTHVPLQALVAYLVTSFQKRGLAVAADSARRDTCRTGILPCFGARIMA